MYLFGASGHAKVIIDCIQAEGRYIIDGICDDAPVINCLSGINVLKSYPDIYNEEKEWVISIGNNVIRKKISKLLKGTFKKIIHPRAVLSSSSKIGKGTVVMAGAVINTDAVIGQHCIVNTCAVIEHDCKIEDYVHISPNAALAGNVKVGEGTHVGIGAVVIQSVTIGKWATIGAGTTVIKDVPDYAVVVGAPGKIIKYNDHTY